MRTTIVIDSKNLSWLQEHADGPRGLSGLINHIIHEHRVYGPVYDRMKTAADRLGQMTLKGLIEITSPWMQGKEEFPHDLR